MTHTAISEYYTDEPEEVPAGPIVVMNELFAQKRERVRAASPFGRLPSWTLDGLIAKSNDDVRQEVRERILFYFNSYGLGNNQLNHENPFCQAFIMQIILYLKNAFQSAGVAVWLHTYKIQSTSKTTGLIQLINNANSIDGIKKREDFPGTLRGYYEQCLGHNVESPAFKQCIDDYVKSMAGYSIISYLLAIKDRLGY